MLAVFSLLGTYAIALLVAGHGVIPLAIALPMMTTEFSQTDRSTIWVAVITGWIGIFFVGITLVTKRSAAGLKLKLKIGVAVALYLSWFCFACAAAMSGDGAAIGNFFAQAVASLPFQITFFAVAAQCKHQIRARRDGERVSIAL